MGAETDTADRLGTLNGTVQYARFLFFAPGPPGKENDVNEKSRNHHGK